MAKSSCFRTPSRSQGAYGFQTMPKSAPHYFSPNFSLFQKKLSWKTSLWIKSKMLRRFVNMLTADDKYSPHSWEKSLRPVQTQLQFQRQVLTFFIAILKSTWTFAHSEKRISLIAQIFSKLFTPKNVLSWMPNSSCFRAPFKNERVHGFQTVMKPAGEHFYSNFPLFQDKLSWKISFWIRSKMLVLFLNTFTADHMYSRESWEKFLQRLQT